MGQVQQIYNKHDSKLILLVTLLLVLYLLSTAAKIVWQFFPEQQHNSTSNVSSVSNNDITTGRNSLGQTNLDSLLNLNLFGSVEQIDNTVQPQPVTDAPETKLNLILSGVVASSDKDRGAAVIAYRNNQETYGVGDQIEGTQVTLEQIYVDRVIIKNRSVRETLMLEGFDFEPSNRASAQSAANPRANTRPTNSRDFPARAADIRQQLSQQPGTFLDYIRLTPATTEEGDRGFMLMPGSKYPELFETLGLQRGDIATELNGLDLSDPEQASEAINALREEEALVLQVIRDDEPVSIIVEIP